MGSKNKRRKRSEKRERNKALDIILSKVKRIIKRRDRVIRKAGKTAKEKMHVYM